MTKWTDEMEMLRKSITHTALNSLLHGRKKNRLRHAVLIVVLWQASSVVLAGPEGGAIVGGAGAIDRAGTTTTINQYTDLMAIDWQSYDVSVDERVRYIQPDSSSVSLNRILSNHGSQIHG